MFSLPDLTMSFATPDVLALFVNVALKGALLVMGVTLVVGLMRRASASARHLAWAALFAGLLALPVIAAYGPTWKAEVLPASWQETAETVAAEVPALAVLPPRVATAPEAPVWSSSPNVAVAPAPAPSPFFAPQPVFASQSGLLPPWQTWTLGMWILAIWAAGALTVLMRYAVGMFKMWRITENATRVEDDNLVDIAEQAHWQLWIARPVRLLQSEDITSPMTWGVWKPVVLLPAEAAMWSEEKLRVVLLHELAHIQRWDCLTQALAQLAAAVHWFNPLVWWAQKQLGLEREYASDDAVIGAGEKASAYATHLLEIARTTRRAQAVPIGAVAMARRSQLEGRVLGILDADRSRADVGQKKTALTLALAALLVLPLAAFTPVTAGHEALLEECEEDSAEPMAMATATNWDAQVASSSDRETEERWSGRVAQGETMEVQGWNGKIVARGTSGDRVEVIATKKARRGDPDRISLKVVEHADGVVICAVFPGMDADDCRPGKLMRTRGNWNNRDNLRVEYEVRVPRGVHFAGRTVNGGITAEGLDRDVDLYTTNGGITADSERGNVRAHTTNGGIRVEAGGSVEANTTNGGITADLGALSWRGTNTFSTTNGTIRVTLPDDADVDIEASTSNSRIRSDFPIDIRRSRYGGSSSAEGRLGNGGRLLKLRTTNGGITIRSASGRSYGDSRERDDRDRDDRERKRWDGTTATAYAQTDAYDYEYDYDYTHDHDCEDADCDHVYVCDDGDCEHVYMDADEISAIVSESMEAAAVAMAAIDFDGIMATSLASAEHALASLDLDALVQHSLSIAESAEGWGAAFDEDFEGEDWDEVRREVRESLHEARFEILDAYTEMGTRGVERLIDIAEDHDDKDVRKHAIKLLRNCDHAKAREAVRRNRW